MSSEEIAQKADAEVFVLAEIDSNFQTRGRARAEIERRRRTYEDARDEQRRHHEIFLFNAEGERDVGRKKFEESLAERQMAHATSLVERQERTAQSIAGATRFAAVSAALSALAAIASVATPIAQLVIHR
jgi:hypothetical protein